MNNSNLVGSIDQGTSSSRLDRDYVFFIITFDFRFIIFEAQSGNVIAEHQIEVEQLFPHER